MSIYDLEQLKQMGVDLSHVPLNNPPSGLQSNFVNPRNEKGSAIGVMSVFMTIMVVFKHKDTQRNQRSLWTNRVLHQIVAPYPLLSHLLPE
ncbi:MAG: hypothetical protein Q9190_006089 [Brigantiaea leucoxantha]